MNQMDADGCDDLAVISDTNDPNFDLGKYLDKYAT
jgi:hypothetical protein